MYPPSTTSEVPVMPDESSQARYSAFWSRSPASRSSPKGRMPSFPNIDDEHMNDLLRYLRTGDVGEVSAGDKKEFSSRLL